jgi:hypothetical protein
LRDLQVRNTRPPVLRPHQEHDISIEEVFPEIDVVSLEERVRVALSNGHKTLSDVLQDVLPDVMPADRYLSVGRIALQVANCSDARSPREREWVAILERLLVEDWVLRNGG